jgi:negative regulator of flagellin synthesis FlgM
MAEKIDGYGRAGLEVSSSRLRNASRADRQKSPDAAPTASAARDAVEFTNTATNLKRIEAALASTPDVDQARVDAIRQRIESGQYAVDPARVAWKLLRMEQDLL